MKTNRSGLLMIVTITMLAASSCSVEYRTRHPKPKPHRVIVVGKAGTNEKATDKQDDKKTDRPSIAVY